MTGSPAATLTGDLLASKGRATAQGFKPTLTVSAPALDRRPVGDAVPPTPAPALKLGRSAGGSGGDAGPERRIKSTIRLDPDRHRRLKLLSAHLGKSGLDILIEALDLYMDRLGPDLVTGSCHCLFDSPKAPGGAQGGPQQSLGPGRRPDRP